MMEDISKEIVIQELEVANQSKLRLIACMSHELKTPLNCTISMLELMEQSIDKNSENRMLLMPALHSSKLLINLVNDLIDFGQMQTG